MKGFLIRLSGEVQAQLLLSIRYWPEYVALWSGFLIIFVALFFGIQIIAEGTTGWGQEAAIRYTIWVLCLTAIVGLPQQIQEEAMTGILEQRFLAPKGGIASLLMSAIARLLFWLFGTTTIFFIMLLVSSTQVHFDVGLLPITVLILMGVQGVGFLLGGLALLLKRIEAITQLLQMALLGVALLPADRLPAAWQAIIQILPLTAGLPLMNDLLLRRIDFETAWNRHDFWVLCVSSIIYLTAGLISLHWIVRRARQHGLLGQY